MNSLLRDCLLAEEQAIAIYEAECLILRLIPLTPLRNKTLKLCLKILNEEKEHRTYIGAYLSKTVGTQLMINFSRLGGYVLGGIFSAIPSPLNWKIHVWAELEAAKVYAKAANTLSRETIDQTLLEELSRAEKQEIEHSMEFKKLRSGIKLSS